MSITTDETRSDAEQVKERVQETAGNVASRTREQLRTQIDERSTAIGRHVGATAAAMRDTSDRLRGEGNEKAASAVDAVAERGERLGSYLEGADGQRLLDDVEDFARRQPWVVVAGSAVAGFLASRFMKASSTTRYQSRVVYPPPARPGGYVAPNPTGRGGTYAPGVDAPSGTGGETGGLG